MAKHLTLEERQFLYRLKKEGTRKSEIARLMGRNRSTIYRELKRNTGQRGYRPKQAQRLAEERRVACRRSWKLDDPNVHRYVRRKLAKLWSPDQIASYARREFPRRPGHWLSRQTIYSWIGWWAPEWCRWLRRQGRPPGRAGQIDRLRQHPRTRQGDQPPTPLR